MKTKLQKLLEKIGGEAKDWEFDEVDEGMFDLRFDVRMYRNEKLDLSAEVTLFDNGKIEAFVHETEKEYVEK